MPIAKLILYKALVNSDIGNNSLSDKSPNESDTKALAFIENIREILYNETINRKWEGI